MLSHFHVKIDWPIDDATEEMAKQLRYISKELYENGEQYAQGLRQRLFAKYGFHQSLLSQNSLWEVTPYAKCTHHR